MLSFHSTDKLAAHYDKISLEQHAAQPHAPIITVKTNALDHEEIVFGTLKTCLPQTNNNEKCKIYVAEGESLCWDTHLHVNMCPCESWTACECCPK
jgi:hypothetical protein